MKLFENGRPTLDAIALLLTVAVINGGVLYMANSATTISVADTQTAAVAYFSTGTVLKVGPTETYKAVASAYAAAVDGDTIEIVAGVYENDFLCIFKNNITFRGVGGFAHMRGTVAPNVKPCNNKGIWVVEGSNNIIENIEFSGATVTGNNGAGVRIGPKVAKLTIRGSYFHDNENGIQGASESTTPLGGTGEIIIENSEFARNGFGDGLTHNIYISRAASVTLRGVYSHDAKKGHNFKTRSRNTFVYSSRFTDEAGNPSFDLDISGGRAYIIGNVIQKSALSDNPTTSINYYTLRDPDGPHELYVLNNTIVNDVVNNAPKYFVFVNSPAFPVLTKVMNNLFIGELGVKGVDVNIVDPNATDDVIENNLWIKNKAESGLVDANGYDYHLTSTSNAINGGVDVSDSVLTPFTQYVHKASTTTRVLTGPLADIGAYEFTGTPTNVYPVPLISLKATPIEGDASSLLTFVANATSCTASGGWTGTWAGTASQGTTMVRGTANTGPISADTVFTFTCVGTPDKAVPGRTASTSITVKPPGAPTLTFTSKAGIASVPPGTRTILDWAGTNVDNCTASGAWAGSKLTSGSYETGPLTESKTYTLTCPALAPSRPSKVVSVTIAVAPYIGPALSQKFRLSASQSEVPTLPVLSAITTATYPVTPLLGIPGTLTLADSYVTFVGTPTGQGSLFHFDKLSGRNAFYNFSSGAMGSLLNPDGGEINATVVGNFIDNFERGGKVDSLNAERIEQLFSATTGVTATDDLVNIKFILIGRGTELEISARAPGAPAPRAPNSALGITRISPMSATLSFDDANRLFAAGKALRVKLAWDGTVQRLYLNDILYAAQTYTKENISWGAGSRFAIGASLNSNFSTNAFWMFHDIIDDVTISSPGVAPTVTTSLLAPESITQTSATLQGTVNPNGAQTTAWFRYDTTNPSTCNDSFGARSPATGGSNVGSDAITQPYTLAVLTLAPKTTYYYCAIGENAVGKAFGAVQSFTTLATPPVLTTVAPNPIAQTSATLKAQVGSKDAPVNAWFRYDTTNPSTCNDSFGARSPATGVKAVPVRASPFIYTQPTTGLTPGTKYYYCVIGENTVKGYGAVVSFTTLP